jgi:DNA-binding transcriptional ArsR family regulator
LNACLAWDAKDEPFAALASLAKALGDRVRAEIADLLARAERSVEDQAAELGRRAQSPR